MSIRNYVVDPEITGNNRLPLFCKSINNESSMDQIINLPATIFTIPLATAIPEFLVSGILIPAKSKIPTSVTFYYRGTGGGSTDAYVKVRSSNNTTIYYQSPMPTSDSTPIVMTKINDLPLTQNELVLDLFCNSAGAGSMFSVALVINYD